MFPERVLHKEPDKYGVVMPSSQITQQVDLTVEIPFINPLSHKRSSEW